MSTKQEIDPKPADWRTAESFLSELERILQKLAGDDGTSLDLRGELERTIVGRIDAFKKAVLKSVMILCANALDNSREIERLNRIVASLPEAREESAELHRILSNIENGRDAGTLSRREKGVLTQLVRGKSNKEISKELDISDKTVKNHLWKIYRKLGVENRTQLFHKLIS